MPQPDEVIIITDESCAPCGALKARLQGQPTVRFVDLQSDEAAHLLGTQTEVLVPLPVARFGEVRKACSLAQRGEQILLVCDEEEIPLGE